MSNQQYLFLFTIGSPQAFIAQARKTHDLYAGSQIISDLTGKAMEAVLQQGNGNSIVFPYIDSWSKPNRFLAKIFDTNIQEFGIKIETAARTRWMQLAVASFRSAGLSQDLQIIDETLLPHLSSQSCLEIIAKISSIAAEQISEYPDIYWAAIAYSDADNYISKVTELERILGGVKNVRKFCQLKEPDGSRKCALDGERTALFYRERTSVGSNNQRPNFLSVESKSVRAFLDPGEALSAVSLVKRFFQKNHSKFPSTAEIALMHLIDERWGGVYGQCFDGEVDYQLFYEENLTKKNLEKKEIRKALGFELEAVVREIRGLTKEKRSKYYAIILFDGDNFGKIWSGETIKDCAGLDGFQKELAKRLHDYAHAAASYLVYPKGKTVYTGGDDFLGFVNLYHLFDVMEELRRLFEEFVSRPLVSYLKEGHSITFTAGVTVAHYKAPLGEVIVKARSTEKSAKKIPGKNSCGLTVMKHSGEMHEGFLCFQPVYEVNGHSEKVNSISLLGKIVEELKREDGFSNTFIKSFGQEMRRMIDDQAQICLGEEAARTELTRLIYRSAKTGGHEKEKAVKSFLEVVDQLRQVTENSSYFLSILEICDFIKRETSRD